MGRLIREDDVMRMLTSVALNNGTITDAKSELRNVKTAYNVEKVVAELPTYEFGVSLLNTEKYVKLSDLKKKIDAIRKGGVE